MNRRRGSVFVVTLAVVAGLVALIAGIAASHREGVHSELRRLEDRRARIMADAAVQHAIAILQPQKVGVALQPSDAWATAGTAGKVSYTLGTDSYRFQILDAGARINLNTVQEDQLDKLPLSKDQVAAFLDWRESKTVARPGGAKDDYYNGLANPYNTKLQPFDSVEELLLVKGFLPSMLYDVTQTAQTGSSSLIGTTTPELNEGMLTVDSQSSDLDPNGHPKVFLTQATPDQLTALGISASAANAIQQAQPTTLGTALLLPGVSASARQIADSTTVNSQAFQTGLININTAPESVLESLPGITPDIANSIVSHQSVGFKSLGELLDIPGVDVNALSNFIDRVCDSSQVFIVRCTGTSGDSQVSLEATLRFDNNGQVVIDRIRSAPFGDMSLYWNWDAQTSSQVDMGGGQS